MLVMPMVWIDMQLSAGVHNYATASQHIKNCVYLIDVILQYISFYLAIPKVNLKQKVNCNSTKLLKILKALTAKLLKNFKVFNLRDFTADIFIVANPFC